MYIYYRYIFMTSSWLEKWRKICVYWMTCKDFWLRVNRPVVKDYFSYVGNDNIFAFLTTHQDCSYIIILWFILSFPVRINLITRDKSNNNHKKSTYNYTDPMHNLLNKSAHFSWKSFSFIIGNKYEGIISIDLSNITDDVNLEIFL